ncbi:helix-turn-helix transcriptional regulator [Actinophytocola oryzae]|uniref:DNA-binding NarL/FixJ family response regulator n=1 Tax=Actinophytocola oryzae TaxID=502181 RepID=A0A4R7VH50_9PSEU|nr:response regulator transcription factor [Actinophytocola oryzae]TDV48656.1 DNA-binding NarL/FixJ family response regulator [Actinophytocola oryzae]
MQQASQQRVRVVVNTPDAISYAGVSGYLRGCPELTLLEPTQRGDADVVVYIPESMSQRALALLRRESRSGKPVVLVANDVSESDLLVAVECGVRAILPRAMATSEQLLHAVLASASLGGLMPPDLLGELLRHVNHLQHEVLGPKGLNAAGLNPREIDVLRLMADGMDTAEIATTLSYSERTVKNIIYALTTRLQLRNRPHAVAYAMRAGVI